MLLEVKEKCSLVIDSQHVKYLRKCTMFRGDVKQNKGNNLTFGVILLALKVMSIKFRLSHMSFLKRILVALFTVAVGNEARVDSVLIQPFLLYYVNHVTFVLKIIIMHTFHKKSREVCINTSSPSSSHSIKSRVLNPLLNTILQSGIQLRGTAILKSGIC